MRLIALGLLTQDASYWEECVKKTLEFCDEFLVFQYGSCEESAKIAWENGALIVDEPIGYLGASDTGEGLTTLHVEAYNRGADAVFMADPTDVWSGDVEEAKRLLGEYEVIKSKMFRARVTEKDEDKEPFDRQYFEPEYNHKVMFVQCRPGRLYWAMYPFWPCGATSCVEYGTVKSYALAHSKDAYRVNTLGTGGSEEPVSAVFARAEDWIAKDFKSSHGNALITEDKFDIEGVELAAT